MEPIDRNELTKRSKWARFVYMLIYAVIFNFSIPFLFGFSLLQFLFYLFTGTVSERLDKVCNWLILFTIQIVNFLLFQSEDPPFPFNDIETSELVTDDPIDNLKEDLEEDLEDIQEDKEESVNPSEHSKD